MGSYLRMNIQHHERASDETSHSVNHDVATVGYLNGVGQPDHIGYKHGHQKVKTNFL
jgi:hypothetical protein